MVAAFIANCAISGEKARFDQGQNSSMPFSRSASRAASFNCRPGSSPRVILWPCRLWSSKTGGQGPRAESTFPNLAFDMFLASSDTSSWLP